MVNLRSAKIELNCLWLDGNRYIDSVQWFNCSQSLLNSTQTWLSSSSAQKTNSHVFLLVNNQPQLSIVLHYSYSSVCLEGKFVESWSIMSKDVKFVALDSLEDVKVRQVEKNMQNKNLPLPASWESVGELSEFVWNLNDDQLFSTNERKINYMIYLKNELSVSNEQLPYNCNCIWWEFVDELNWIAQSPLDQFAITPLGKIHLSFLDACRRPVSIGYG